ARLMSQALRKLTGLVSKSHTVLVFINQIREKIGVMFGSPETTTGGRALKFYSSIRVDIRRIAAIKDGDAVIGNRTRAKVVKNKVAAPFREAEFDIMYVEGIPHTGDLVDLATERNLIEKSGSWYSYKGERIGQGRENAKQYLAEHPDLTKKLDHEMRKILGLPAPESPPPPPAACERRPFCSPRSALAGSVRAAMNANRRTSRGGRAVGTAGQVGAERPRNSVGRSAPGDRSGAGPAGLGSRGASVAASTLCRASSGSRGEAPRGPAPVNRLRGSGLASPPTAVTARGGARRSRAISERPRGDD